MYGIKRELTCPYTSYQNGQAERHIGILFAAIRTVLADSKLPAKFWAEALLWCAYVHNRTPGPSGKTPFELRYNRRPEIGHLRPFGCPCTVLLRKSKNKGHVISEYGTLVGYGYVTGQKGYRILLNKSSPKVLVSQNVAFTAYDKGIQHRVTNFANLEATNEVFEIEQDSTQEPPC